MVGLITRLFFILSNVGISELRCTEAPVNLPCFIPCLPFTKSDSDKVIEIIVVS